jgi:hypothetical protein
MGETTQNTTGACEQLLDYVYGELDEAGKRAFEEHLPTCARCQAGVKSFGRVRTAAKRLMPSVEPTASLGGALHAQLMHAAAQRKPRRGVLLAFPRKIVEHPAWAAAAMFAIVGSAVALNWSRGKMAMPTASDETKAAESPVVTSVPAVAEPVPAEKTADKSKEEAEAGKLGATLGAVGSKGDAVKGGADYKDATKISLDAPPAGRMTVQRPATHHAAAEMPAKLAPPPDVKMKKVAKTVAAPQRDLVDDSIAADGEVGGVVNGAGGASRSSGVAEGAPKSSAPASGTRKAEELAKERQKQAGYYAPPPPAAKPSPTPSQQQTWANNSPASPPPQAAVANTSPVPVTETTSTGREEDRYRGKAQSSVQGPTQQSADVEALRKKLIDYATSGRCAEAVKTFQELDKRTAFISPKERVQYARCLMQLNRDDQAQQAIDELKNDKRPTNLELQQVENELANKRRVTVEKKAKKSPAPADRRPADAQTQRAEPAPAQAAPPARSDEKKSSNKSAY